MQFRLSADHVEALHRARVADAFVDVVAERGYAATTVADVATRAVMSSRTFYRLYDNKAEAFTEVHRALQQRACERMQAAMQQHDEPRDKLCAALKAILALVDEHPAWARTFMADVPASADGSGAPQYLVAIRNWLEAGADLLPPQRDMTPLEQGAAVSGIVRARLVDDTRPAAQLLPALSQVLLGERVDGVVERPLDGTPAASVALTWDALVQALVAHDVETLAAVQRQAEASLHDGGGAAHPAELAAMVEAAAVGRHGGPAAVLALIGHGSAEGLPSRQSLRCLRYIATHPGTSGRGVLHGLGFRNESQVSRLLSGLAARGLAEGTGAVGRPRSWRLTASGETLLRTYELFDEPPPDGDDADEVAAGADAAADGA